VPLAAFLREQDGAAARTAEDEAGLDDFRRDQHRLGAADVLLQPRHFRVAQEIRERGVRLVHELLLLGLRAGGDRGEGDDRGGTGGQQAIT